MDAERRPPCRDEPFCSCAVAASMHACLVRSRVPRERAVRDSHTRHESIRRSKRSSPADVKRQRVRPSAGALAGSCCCAAGGLAVPGRVRAGPRGQECSSAWRRPRGDVGGTVDARRLPAAVRAAGPAERVAQSAPSLDGRLPGPRSAGRGARGRAQRREARTGRRDLRRRVRARSGEREGQGGGGDRRRRHGRAHPASRCSGPGVGRLEPVAGQRPRRAGLRQRRRL